ERSLRWTEQMDVLIGTSKAVSSVPLELQGQRSEFKIPARLSPPEFVLPNGGGLAYGDFTLDDTSRAFLLQHLPELADLARGAAFLERVWRRQEKIPGLTLAEPDEASMALDLAVRSVPAAASILEEQRARFMNPDRKERFEFVIPALSDRQETRDAWFESLRDV